MPRVSKKPLDKDIKKEMYKQFWKSLAKINNPKKAYQFFSDILTETEKITLAKRFATAILLTRGHSATSIRKTMNLSYAAIGSVASWVKNAKPKTKEVLEKLSKEKDWESFGDKIDEFLDKIPPHPRSDWKKVYKERRKQAYKRSARKSLR